MAVVSPRALPARRRVSALYCATYGFGTPLLLLHGFGESGDLFQPLIPALAAHFHVIVPDLRGHGLSQRLPAAENMQRFAEDIGNLLDLLGIERCFVLGHAAGAAIAQEFARMDQDRVLGMVLINAFARNTTSLREQIEARLRNGGRLVSKSVPPSSSATSNKALVPFDSRPWAASLAVPTLVIGGQTENGAQELAARLPHATLHQLGQAGTNAISDMPRDVLTATLPWLEAQRVEVAA